MRGRAASLVGTASSLLAGIAVPIAFPHVEPWVGQYLLLAAAFLFALTIGLWWPHKNDVSGLRGTQTTFGPSSPAIGVMHGDVITNNAPAAVQERKSPYGSGRSPSAT